MGKIFTHQSGKACKKAQKAFKRDKFHATFRGHVIAFAESYGIKY